MAKLVRGHGWAGGFGLKQYPEDAGAALSEPCRCGDDVATCDALSPRVSRSHETGTPGTSLTHT